MAMLRAPHINQSQVKAGLGCEDVAIEPGMPKDCFEEMGCDVGNLGQPKYSCTDRRALQ